MGHYASEVDPNWGDSIDRTDHEIKLRNKVDTMNLAKFIGSDFPILQKLYSNDYLSPSDEKRLSEIINS